jgi:hypothetical protein
VTLPQAAALALAAAALVLGARGLRHSGASTMPPPRRTPEHGR